MGWPSTSALSVAGTEGRAQPFRNSWRGRWYEHRRWLPWDLATYSSPQGGCNIRKHKNDGSPPASQSSRGVITGVPLNPWKTIICHVHILESGHGNSFRWWPIRNFSSGTPSSYTLGNDLQQAGARKQFRLPCVSCCIPWCICHAWIIYSYTSKMSRMIASMIDATGNLSIVFFAYPALTMVSIHGCPSWIITYKM